MAAIFSTLAPIALYPLGLLTSSYFLFIFAAGLAYIVYHRSQCTHWKDQGISGPSSWPFIGTTHYIWRKGLREGDMEVMETYGKDTKVVGLYESGVAKLLTTDEDIIREVLVKDFNNFSNRMPPKNCEYFDDTIKEQLVCLFDDEWKRVRSTLTPTFSTSKLKTMMKSVDQCANMFLKELSKKVDKQEDIDLKEYCGRLTMDIIASTAFGYQVSCQEEHNSVFERMAKQAMKPRLSRILAFLLPGGMKLTKMLGIPIMDEESFKFFTDIVEQALDGRTGGDKTHKDFIQLMANAHRDNYDQAEVAKEVAEDGISLEENGTPQKGLTRQQVLAQGFLFFAAGYDTVATALGILFYSMALHPEYQVKVQQEIDDVTGDRDHLQYSDIQSLTYLDQCLQETLRLYGQSPRAERAVSRDVIVKGIHLKKDQMVGIPIYCRHMDPKIWPNPKKFDPSRFSPEEKARHSPYDHMPFGYGPRNCIAMRLALMEIKLVAAKTLRQYTFSTCEKTTIPLSVDKFRGSPNKGVWLHAEQRAKTTTASEE